MFRVKPKNKALVYITIQCDTKFQQMDVHEKIALVRKGNSQIYIFLDIVKNKIE